MRGKRTVMGVDDAGRRITPADAGKTEYRLQQQNILWDHPRGCGENIYCRIEGEDAAGSPPRMRGKQSATFLRESVRRITPADAGKTNRAARHRRSHWDHPRGCGENNAATVMKPGTPGSPPRMRGKPADAATTPAPTRITPADAGKTRNIRSPQNPLKDHPRGCGENVQAEQAAPYDIGSPPRMRGKHCQGLLDAWLTGITPADAGKTSKIEHISLSVQDHPRGCGENTFVTPTRGSASGSPPRMRGKR